MCLNFCHLDPEFNQLVKSFNMSYFLIIMAPLNTYCWLHRWKMYIPFYPFYYCVWLSYPCYYCVAFIILFDGNDSSKAFKASRQQQPIPSSAWNTSGVTEVYRTFSILLASLLPSRCLQGTATDVDDCIL